VNRETDLAKHASRFFFSAIQHISSPGVDLWQNPN
jgi:hypothetical protein